MRICALLGIIAAMLPLGAYADGPVQDQQRFQAAILDHSTAPFFVLVTIVDDRTGQSRTGCLAAPFLLGAIERELDLPSGLDMSDRSVQIALGNPDHVFHFSKQAALDNVATSGTLFAATASTS